MVKVKGRVVNVGVMGEQSFGRQINFKVKTQHKCQETPNTNYAAQIVSDDIIVTTKFAKMLNK